MSMKTFKTMAAFTLAATLCLNTTSCNKEDAPIKKEETKKTDATSPAKVFTGGLPKSAAGATLIYNAEGLLTQITPKDGSKITFEYFNATRANSRIRMTVLYPSKNEMSIYDFQTNENGFAKHCTVSSPDSDSSEAWDLEYNAAGNLTDVKRVKKEAGQNSNLEITNIEYKDGDIMYVKRTEGEGDDVYSALNTMKYVSETQTSPMANKGCVMLFDEVFGLDLEDLEYAYYAGLLGRSSKSLPLERSRKYNDGETESLPFKWTLNTNGLPTQLEITEIKNEVYTDTISFRW